LAGALPDSRIATERAAPVNFLVSLLGALGLPISGEFRRRAANRIYCIWLKWRTLAS